MKKYLFFLLFLLCCLSVCRASSNSDDANHQTNELKAVTGKLVELLEDGKLPGLSKDDHGDMHGYQLTDSVRELLLDKKLLNKKMLHDVDGYHDPYFVGVDTKDGRHYGYFFSPEEGDVLLVSSYHWDNGEWVKIHAPIP
jgi:hypothetical protein